jgi:uncharacterized protein YndB with AHSA1/START domain
MNKITIETIVNAPIKRVWDCWTLPEHIVRWSFASADWEASDAENDLRVGGQFKTTLSAKDKSSSFDFTGSYKVVEKHSKLEYTLEDGRQVSVSFIETPAGIKVIETFDAEKENSIEAQRAGWQSFLDNFKKHAESK